MISGLGTLQSNSEISRKKVYITRMGLFRTAWFIHGREK
jgi:hypothetical protein